MLDLVRRHIVILTAAALGYSGYSFYDGGAGKPEAHAKSELTGIDPAFLAVRDPSVPFVVASDPYRLEGLGLGEGEAPGGAAGKGGGSRTATAARSAAASATTGVAPRLTQTDLMLAFAGALRQVAGETHDLILGRGPKDAASTSGAASVVSAAATLNPGTGAGEAPLAGFTLLLQSTLDMRGGSTARINGRTVAEGEAMAFLDPAAPPVLRRVKGTAVIVRYGERDYVADLLENPLLQVGLPVVASAATPAAPAPAPLGPAPKAAAAPEGTGSATAKPPKKKGTYRVRGSTKKP